MKIHLSSVAETELTSLFPQLAGLSTLHTLTTDPAAADLILLLGSFGRDPQHLLDHPLYLAFPDKCAVYTEDDNYLPLAPGVYCSAMVDRHSRVGRTFSFCYVSCGGQYSNPFVTTTSTNAGVTKTFLFSFQGGSTSLLRKKLFNLDFNRPGAAPAALIENTSATYFHWDLNQPGREARQQRYARTMAASHFVLCPHGAGTGSLRLFEVMSAGIAPVLISDDYLLPPHIDWNAFLIRIPESDIARLPELLESHIPTAAERGRLARLAWLQHFAPDREFDAIVASCLAALRHGPPAEEKFRRQQRKLIALANLRRISLSLARSVFLTALKVLHLNSPYQMNR